MSVRPAVFRRPPVQPESERQFQSAILELAKVLGWHAYHSWSSLHSAAGYPDLTLCHPGQRRLLFAEIKRAGGRVTPAQENWLEELAACGAETCIWRAGETSLAAIAEILRGGT